MENGEERSKRPRLFESQDIGKKEDKVQERVHRSLKKIVVQFPGTDRKREHHGGVAQLGEHLPCKQGVMGSNPIISTKDR